MKFYMTKTGRWSTRADGAKQLANEDGTTFEQVDVPTTQAGLVEFLNKYRVGAEDDVVAVQLTAKTPDIQPQIDEALADAKRQLQAEHNINVEEQIGRADYDTAIRLSEHSLGRLNEHVRSIKATGEPAA